MAVVNGQVITLSDVRAALDLGLLPGQPADLAEALDGLVRRELVLDEVSRYLPPEPAPEAIEAGFARLRSRFGSEDDWRRSLAAVGYSPARVREFVRNDLRIESYLAERFGSSPPPGDEAVREYYRDRAAEFVRDGARVPFEEVQDTIRAHLAAEERTARIDRWLEELRRRGDITILYLPGG